MSGLSSSNVRERRGEGENQHRGGLAAGRREECFEVRCAPCFWESSSFESSSVGGVRV